MYMTTSFEWISKGTYTIVVIYFSEKITRYGFVYNYFEVCEGLNYVGLFCIENL